MKSDHRITDDKNIQLEDGDRVNRKTYCAPQIVFIEDMEAVAVTCAKGSDESCVAATS